MNEDYLIEQIAANLQEGKVILYPTDTVWGIGCDATNSEKVLEIYRIKSRPTNKPFILLVSSLKMLKDYVVEIHPRIEVLLEHHIRPLTLIFPKAKNLPPCSYGENGSVAIRVCKNQFTSSIIETLGKPIISTSANISSEPSPTIFSEVTEAVKNQMDYIVPLFQDEQDTKTPSVIAIVNNDDGSLEFIR